MVRWHRDWAWTPILPNLYHLPPNFESWVVSYGKWVWNEKGGGIEGVHQEAKNEKRKTKNSNSKLKNFEF